MIEGQAPIHTVDGKRRIAHLTSSRFYGGPERQMLGLAQELRHDTATEFISFSEGGLCRRFLTEAKRQGFAARELRHDTPRLFAVYRELVAHLAERRVQFLLCHGYKAGALGLLAARRLRIPAVAVSRGWTAESVRVRIYEMLDRMSLRFMNYVVCVSDGQATKVRRLRLKSDRVGVIRNAIDAHRFQPVEQGFRRRLLEMFPESSAHGPLQVIGAAGRLSPEKAYHELIDAAAIIRKQNDGVRFVLFGDGPQHVSLARRIERLQLNDCFRLAGATDCLDQFMPHFDMFVQSSITEGLPNVLLEAGACGVPTVATNVGGTCEVVLDGRTGVLVPPGAPEGLAEAVNQLLGDHALRSEMSRQAVAHIKQHFTFVRQADAYRELFVNLSERSKGRRVSR